MLSLDLPEPLERVQKAIFSRNPAEELNNIINNDLSRANVQSYVRSLIPKSIENLQQAAASDDLLQNLIRTYAEDPRIRAAASDNDVQSILDVLNYEIGGSVLVISNTSIVIDVDALAEVLGGHATAYIQNLYPDNLIMQVISHAVAGEQIKVISSNLESLLADKGIPVELIEQVISLISNSSRRKRDLVTDIVLALVRPWIANFLTPICTQFNTVAESILTTILSFYEATEPSTSIQVIMVNCTNTVIIRIAEVIVVFQTEVNAVFSNLINGTVTTTARRRRDVDQDFENLYDFNDIALRISRRRVTRDVVTDVISLITSPISFIFSAIVSPITNILNAVVKNVFITLLSSQYATIGELVTLPLRFVVNSIVDLILPCTDCTSIV